MADVKAATPRPTLQEWLAERSANCLRIASTKRGEDARGWLDDAQYFNEAIDLHSELVSALRGIVNWCEHPGHGGQYAIPKPLTPYLDKARAVLAKIPEGTL